MTRTEAATQIAKAAQFLPEKMRREVLRAIRRERVSAVSINDAIDAWCAPRSTSREEMRSRVKTRVIADQRQHLYKELDRQGFSSVEIGTALDRDHSTILAGLDALRERTAETKARWAKGERGRSDVAAE